MSAKSKNLEMPSLLHGEWSLTLGMRLALAEETEAAEHDAYMTAYPVWQQTRDPADRETAFTHWLNRNNARGLIQKLIKAGPEQLAHERGLGKHLGRLKRRWHARMAGEMPDNAARAFRWPELIGHGTNREPRFPEFGAYQGPEWNRLEALGQRHLAVWQQLDEHEALAGQAGKMKRAFGQSTKEKKSAGQRRVYPSTEELQGPRHSADLQICTPLWRPEHLKAKLTAELDGHELSKDWDGHLEAQVAYHWAMNQLIEGGDVFVHQLREHWAFLTKVCENGAQLMRAGEHGCVTALSDPDTESARVVLGSGKRQGDDEDEDEELREYPGCPAGVNPLAGRYIGKKALDCVLKAWATQEGRRTGDRRIARWVNERRDILGLAGHRYLSVANAGRLRRLLTEAGRLIETKATEHFRRMHVWRTLPCACVPPGPRPPRREGSQLSQEEVDSAFSTIREDLEKDVPDPSG